MRPQCRIWILCETAFYAMRRLRFPCLNSESSFCATSSLILILRNQKLLVCCFRRAGIRWNQLAAIRFVRVLHIFHPRLQALCYGLSLVDVHRNNSSGRHTFLHKKKSGDLWCTQTAAGKITFSKPSLPENRWDDPAGSAEGWRLPAIRWGLPETREP